MSALPPKADIRSLSEYLRQPRDIDRDPPRLVKGQFLGLDGFAFGGTRIEIGERLTCRIANHIAARKFLFAPRRGEASSHCVPLHAIPSTAATPARHTLAYS